MHLSTMDAFKNLKSGDLVTVDDEMLKKIQNVLLGILDDIITVCEKYKIPYTLGGGSVLGAVRHQGFIPWDDDIDVNFSRRDYERFIPAFRKEFGEKYWIHTPEATDNYGLLFARVRLKGTMLRTRDDFWTEECGAFVDLFILENTFDNLVLRWIHGMGCQALGLLLSCRKFYRDRKFMLELAHGNPELLRAVRVKIALGFCASIGSVNFWTRLANRWSGLCRDDHSEMVAAPAGRKKFWGELYRRRDMLEIEKKTFEGRCVNCPKNYEMYLTHMYGDYMTLPPEEDRERHPFFGEIKL